MDPALQAFQLPNYSSWTSGHHNVSAARRDGDSFLAAEHGTPYGYADDSRAVQERLLRLGGHLRPDCDTALAAQVVHPLPRRSAHRLPVHRVPFSSAPSSLDLY